MNVQNRVLLIAALATAIGVAGWSFGLQNSARAQASIPQVVGQSCAKDIKNICPKITPGGGRVVACLFAHNDKITGDCMLAIIDGSVALNATIASLQHLAKTTSCRSDLRQYCRGIPAGGGRRAALPLPEEELRHLDRRLQGGNAEGGEPAEECRFDLTSTRLVFGDRGKSRSLLANRTNCTRHHHDARRVGKRVHHAYGTLIHMVFRLGYTLKLRSNSAFDGPD